MRISTRDAASLRGQFGGIAPENTLSAPARFDVMPTTEESGLNKMEQDWLDVMRMRGYQAIRVQSQTFKLGHDTRYTPDFSAIVDGRKVFYETKGYMRDDARVKVYVAARDFREYTFVIVKREHGEWKEIEVKP